MREHIRVVVVDDHEVLADALLLLFSRHPIFELLGCAVDADEAVDMTVRKKPDVVLLDLDLEGLDAVETVRMIKGARRSTTVVAVGSFNDLVAARDLIAAGASGCVEKRQAAEDVLDLARRAFRGEIVMPDVDPVAEVDGPPALYRPPVPARALGRLTSRETEILQTLAGGDSIAGAAERLGISPLTVENHVKSILAKLGVHSKIEAVMLAWRHGLGRETRTG